MCISEKNYNFSFRKFPSYIVTYKNRAIKKVIPKCFCSLCHTIQMSLHLPRPIRHPPLIEAIEKTKIVEKIARC